MTNFEAALGAPQRVSADPAASTKFEKLRDTVGELTVPRLTMHKEHDPLVLVANETVLAQRVQARAVNGRLAQLYIAPPASHSQSTGAPYGPQRGLPGFGRSGQPIWAGAAYHVPATRVAGISGINRQVGRSRSRVGAC